MNKRLAITFPLNKQSKVPTFYLNIRQKMEKKRFEKLSLYAFVNVKFKK